MRPVRKKKIPKYYLMSRLLVPAILFFCLISLVYSQDVPDTSQTTKPDSIRSVFQLYNQGQYRRTLDQIVRATLPDSSPMIPVLLELKIQCYRFMRNDDLAIQTANQFFKSFSDHPLAPVVEMALGDMDVNRLDFVFGLKHYLKARVMIGNQASPDSIDNRILRIIPYAARGIQMDSLYKWFSDSTISPELDLIKAYQLLTQSHVDQAAITLSRINRESLPVKYQSFYDHLLLRSYQTAHPAVMIGAILPLTGDKSDEGKMFLKGLQKGISEASNPNIEFQVMVLDNGSDPIRTIELSREIANNPAFDLVIGPLTETNSILTANTLSETEVPVILPVSITSGLVDLGDNILQLNGDLSSRGRIVARYCYTTLGLNSMAILAPADQYGQPIVDAFTEEYEYLGGKILASEWYSGKPENLRKQFSIIRSKAWALEAENTKYDDLLGMQIDSLEGLFNIDAQTFFDLPKSKEKSLSQSDSSKVNLNTIPGIFMPIHPEDVTYIGTQFPLYNLNSVIVGDEGWQNLDILNQEIVGPHVQGLTTLALGNVDAEPDEDALNIDKAFRRLYVQGKDLVGFLNYVCPDSAPDQVSILASINQLKNAHSGIRTYYFSNSEPKLNQAYHVYRYEGTQFIDQGVFIEDSLWVNPPMTP